jgi:hypothetical protein
MRKDWEPVSWNQGSVIAYERALDGLPLIARLERDDSSLGEWELFLFSTPSDIDCKPVASSLGLVHKDAKTAADRYIRVALLTTLAKEIE